MDRFAERDSVLERLVAAELDRERGTLNAVASENYASPAVLSALSSASLFTNKYASGKPGHRSLPGCEHVDELERLAQSRAREVFGADHANVQPYSGTLANATAYTAVLDPGDRILSMNPAHGGHRSHGKAGNVTAQRYEVAHYGVGSDSGRIDYDEVTERAAEFEPDLLISGASAYPRQIDFERFGEIASDVGAVHLADVAHIAGLIAAGVHPSPVGHAALVTLTTHKTLRGPRGGLVLCEDELADAVDVAIYPTGVQGGPLVDTIAAKAACLREAGEDEFVEYQKRVVENARVMANVFRDDGWSLQTDGTNTHVLVVDLSAVETSAETAMDVLVEAGLAVNTVPVPHTDGAGLRIGTAALTTRGLGAEDIRRVAEAVSGVLAAPGDEKSRADISETVDHLCKVYPLYPSVSDPTNP